MTKEDREAFEGWYGTQSTATPFGLDEWFRSWQEACWAAALTHERARIAGMEERVAESLYLYDRPKMFRAEDASLPWADLGEFGRTIYLHKARAVITEITRALTATAKGGENG